MVPACLPLDEITSASCGIPLGFNPWEPPPFEPTIFRRRVLALLEACPDIECKFILRDKYRAGYRAPKKDPFHPTRLEYVQNMLDSDYIVCMRGGGNFSVRFYETLSLGRIPVFVDTDCMLPYDHVLDYRTMTIWITKEKILEIGSALKAFHSSLTSDVFSHLQQQCRQLWQEMFSITGFYAHFHLHW